jgi:hypothetical protein
MGLEVYSWDTFPKPSFAVVGAALVFPAVPVRHWHGREDEGFVVLAGENAFRMRARRNSSNLPRSLRHAQASRSPQHAKVRNTPPSVIALGRIAARSGSILLHLVCIGMAVTLGP